MGKRNRCCVGGCNNDQRYPELVVKRSHVTRMIWHLWPKDQALSKQWRKSVSKGRDDFIPGPYMTVCSNHFVDGKRTNANPVPTLFMTVSDQCTPSPHKRRKVERSSSSSTAAVSLNLDDGETSESEQSTPYSSFTFTQITRETDVRFYAGLPSTTVFKFLFDWLLPKAKHMQYWNGGKKESENRPERTQTYLEREYECLPNKPGRGRALCLEQEFLLVLMRLRLGLLGKDLAFRFQIAQSVESSIFVS